MAHIRKLLQGGQQTLEDPEKPWIFFAPGKIPLNPETTTHPLKVMF